MPGHLKWPLILCSKTPTLLHNYAHVSGAQYKFVLSAAGESQHLPAPILVAFGKAKWKPLKIIMSIENRLIAVSIFKQ